MIQFPGKTASIKRHSSLMCTDGLGVALVWIYNWMAVVLTFVRFGVCVCGGVVDFDERNPVT